MVWLIKNTDDFYIDIEEFQRLVHPTPLSFFPNSNQVNMHFSSMINPIINANDVKMGIDFELETGSKLQSQPFLFSDEIRGIVERKNTGNYIPPDWKRTAHDVPDHKEHMKQTLASIKKRIDAIK